MPPPRHCDASARRALVVLVASGGGALLCVPAALLGGRDTVLLLQALLVAATFGAAGVYRHRTRVYGDRPGERAPLVLAHPRKAARDRTATVRLAAGFAMLAAALYFLGLLSALVSPTLRDML